MSIRFGAHKPYRFHAPFVIHWLSSLAYVMSDCCLLCFTCNFAYSVCLTLCICMTIKLFWIWIWIWMITSSNGNIFRVTGPLCGEFTGQWWIPLTKASDAELWCFLWSVAEQSVEQTIETPVIWDAIALIMMSLQVAYCSRSTVNIHYIHQWSYAYHSQMKYPALDYYIRFKHNIKRWLVGCHWAFCRLIW